MKESTARERLMEVEKLLSSKGRIKILKVLFKEEQINITRLVRETGLHHKLVVKHIEELKELGVVGERRYGKLRLVYIDLSDPRVSIIREALRSLELL